ncbi:acetylxylan esterase [Roseiconus lacunae]|uniref:acetylxylan esterase n=1 Tax=Roseiconus lacunae TaxID=2605694 RepID=UPI00308FCB07|nr:acetylxylan esterase [Stieleria sp. HD01]
MRTRCQVFALVLCWLVGADTVSAQETSPDSKTPPLKTLNDHFPFDVPETVELWQQRREDLRRRVLVANGLWPMPEKTPLKPVIHGRIERDGFVVDRVYFQSLPGHYVSGMLFRPAEGNTLGVIDGKRPAVLSPHGHGGRTMKLSDDALKKQLETGGEIFEQSGRYPKLARCAHLARMGCVTFIFDMLGYADSQQITYQTAHRHADARPEESNREQPIFFSIDADLNLQSIMGLQTWNAIRSLDFLASLPEVDEERLGVTGGSGGGTQTILLSAIDPRVKVAFPNGMVSTSMQGGCYCENCNYLRIGTGNVELAALFAPKPQGMTAADDWTKAMLDDGFPELKQLYTMLGKPDHVICGDLLKFPHNYNHVTRAIMYPFMAKHLGLPSNVPLEEQDYQPFSETEMAVYNDQHPAPDETGVDHERKVLAWWTNENQRALADVVPESSTGENADQWKRYQDVIGGAWRVIFDRDLPAGSEVNVEQLSERVEQGVRRQHIRVSHPEWKTSVEAIVFRVADADAKPQSLVVNPSHDGMQEKWLLGDTLTAFKENYPRSALVIPFLQAPEREGGNMVQPLIDDKRSYSGFTFGYNRPLVVKRCDQLLCVLAMAQGEVAAPLRLVGQFPASIAAGVIAGDAVDELVLTDSEYRFSTVERYQDADFVPGAAKYFDLPGLIALRAPHGLAFEGGEVPNLVERVYAAAGASERLTRSE